MKEIIKSNVLPQPIGSYSQGIKIDNLIFLSGQIAILENIEEQTSAIFNNIDNFLKERSLSMNDIIKTTIYLKNIDDFSIVNKIYEKFFTDYFPARVVVEVSRLPKNVLIEVEAIINEEN